MPHHADDVLHGAGALRAFDDQRELSSRREEIDRFLSIAVEGAVDDIGPRDQVLEIRRIVAEFFARHGGDVFGAGAEGGIEKFVAADVVAEMHGVLGREESALMMIEPPGQAGVGRILEIDDGVDIAVEHGGLEQLRGFMGQAGIDEVGAGIEFFSDKTAEEGRRGGAVEAMVVIENANPHV